MTDDRKETSDKFSLGWGSPHRPVFWGEAGGGPDRRRLSFPPRPKT